jgi:hypothetical protein
MWWSPNSERFQPPKPVERHRRRDRHVDPDRADVDAVGKREGGAGLAGRRFAPLKRRIEATVSVAQHGATQPSRFAPFAE